MGVAKSTIGYYENENRIPDIEVLSRICDEFNVPADYMLGRTNTVAVKGKKKDVCELTGISDAAADFLFGLVNHQRYGEINKLNYLLEDLANDYNEDYDMQGDRNLESASSIFNAVFSYMEKFAL
ncbi:MAG: helix-turn-helix domain-containing protein [Acetatifactor sp.]|nr:helix-turn-helix domain-containing protein [Acetatifactor sp.]